MNDIIIGKHTLESLTSGMYSDPYVVYREYIQNAADSIDEAARNDTLRVDEGEISISLFPDERKVIISDNGSGICSNSAETTLISIGNSKKTSDNSRGFRGIGRLSALSYCTILTFETSAYSEKIGTRVRIDAKRLSELLLYNDGTDASAIDVLKEVCFIESYQEKNTAHYFRVYMDGVDETSGLVNYENVVAYIEQNAPVPYEPLSFTWGKEICNRLGKEGLPIHSYNISVTIGNKTVQVYKPYKDKFLVDKGKDIIDKIKDVDVIKINRPDGTISAIGWIAITNYRGSICDKSIKGIRLRKGNILIGDSQTLNIAFKDARFNGWSIGEIFALDAKLIPNARRDNFEKNPAYFLLLEHLTTVASEIARDIRSASLARNAELSDALSKTESIAKSANTAIAEGVSCAKKGTIKSELTNVQATISKTQTSDDVGTYYQKIAFDELDMLIGKLQGATSYKALNIINGLDKTEKKILERVFNILLKVDKEHADQMVTAILDDFLEEKNLLRNKNDGTIISD